MSFISYLINGISLGSVYALIALGYTMVYGIAKMLNFAHGDVIMVGGYAVFLSISSLNCRCIYYLYNVQYHGDFSCDWCSGSCCCLYSAWNGY